MSPAHFRNAEGTASNTLPFGNLTATVRYMQIHDDVPAMTVNSIAFRHDAGVVAHRHSVRLDAWASTAVTTSATANATFDLNHGVDKQHVISTQWINQNASDPADLPGQWVLRYPFDSPFVFAGNGSLCWEVHVTGKSQTAEIAYDSCLGPDSNPEVQVARAYTGCRSTGATRR